MCVYLNIDCTQGELSSVFWENEVTGEYPSSIFSGTLFDERDKLIATS